MRGSLDDGDFTAFYLDDGRVAAALTVGRSDDLEHATRFVRGGAGSPARWPPNLGGLCESLAGGAAG